MKEVLLPLGIASALIAAALYISTASTRQADVASRNISRAADEFQINRRIVFLNGITDTYLLTIEGMCALGNADKPREVTVTCKTGPGTYKKHFLGLSDNVTFFAEQRESAEVSAYHYKVIFKPQTLLPDVEVDTAAPYAK